MTFREMRISTHATDVLGYCLLVAYDIALCKHVRARIARLRTFEGNRKFGGKATIHILVIEGSTDSKQ
jgi:hypothetical protein